MQSVPILRHLADLDSAAFVRLTSGYTSPAKYAVHKDESETRTTITLDRVTLPEPYQKTWTYSTDDLDRYTALVREEGLSWGAFVDDTQVGIALGEAHTWNGTLWLWELHVAPAWQGQNIGRTLVDTLAEAGRAAGLRTLRAEVQNTNVPAIDFYRRVGFTLEGIDLSYYANDDVDAGEVALFMKRRLC